MDFTDTALDLAFFKARTEHQFLDRAIDDELLRRLYDVCKWGPTSVSCQPMRLVFVRSEEAKLKLKPSLMPGNVDKTMAAPVTAVVAIDKRFYEQLPTQFPFMPQARDMLAADEAFASFTGTLNASLQGAYLIIAARLLGLGAGPMSGFDAAKVNEAFFPDGDWHAHFLVNLGYADDGGFRPRGPRLAFDEVARVV